MSFGITDLDGRVEAWWRWFTMALFLLIPVDLFTTLVAVARYGTAVESNPLMRWLLERGLLEVTVANLVAAVVVVLLFHAVVEGIRRAPRTHRETFARAVNVWIGFVFVAGVALTTNNVLIIV